MSDDPRNWDAPPTPDFTYAPGGDAGFTPTPNPQLKDFFEAQTNPNWTNNSSDFLARLQQYDPNARFVTEMGGGDDPRESYRYDFDTSKLPGTKYGTDFGFGGWTENLYDPNLRYEDPIYGWVTPSKNMKDEVSWLDWGGPLAVSLMTAGLAGPAAFAAMTPGQMVAQAAPQFIGKLANGGKFDPMSLLQFVGPALGAAGIQLPPEVLTAIKYAPTAVKALGILNSYSQSNPEVAKVLSSQGLNNMTINNPEQNYTMPDFSAGGGGGFDISQILQSLGISPGGLTSNTLPGLASAYQQWQNGNQYMDMATKYADKMDPFGSQRQQYQKLLSDSYTNPAAFLNDPGHKAIQDKQAGALSARLAASGYLGAGKMSTDMMDFLSQSDAQWLDQERARLGGLAGAGIGPGAAADLIKSGIQGSVKAKSDALGMLTQALTKPTANPAGGYGGGGTTGGFSPTQAAQLIKEGWRWVSAGNGVGFFMDPATGRVQYSPGNIGDANQGGFVGDQTDPTQGYGTQPDESGNWNNFAPTNYLPINDTNLSGIDLSGLEMIFGGGT